MLTSVYDTHKNNKNNDKRVIGIAQLCFSAVLKTGKTRLTSKVRLKW